MAMPIAAPRSERWAPAGARVSTYGRLGRAAVVACGRRRKLGVRLPRSSATGPAEAVQFHFVVAEDEAGFLGDFVLQAFDVRVEKLDDGVALGADEVVVMLARCIGTLVARLAIEKMPRGSQTTGSQQLHGAVDGRLADFRVDAPRPLQDLFDGKMAGRAEENVGDDLALPRCFQAVAQQVLFELAMGRLFVSGIVAQWSILGVGAGPAT
jgi:hypothetical protein